MKAEPMPVPRVITRTVPATPAPAPKRASARPAASASLMTSTGRPRRAVNSASMSRFSHAWSTFAAEWTTPCWMIPGKVTPTGESAAGASGRLDSSATTWATTSATASGVEGLGVGTRSRSPISLPFLRSTIPPLMPVPPMSMPISGAFFFDFSSFLANGLPFVAGAGWVFGGAAESGEGEDFGAGLRDQQGVLELRGPLVVSGHDGPVVGPHVPIDCAQREHGLDREDHTGFHDGVVGGGRVVVRDDQPGVEGLADAVPGEIPDDAVAEALGVGLDGPADHVDFAAGSHRPDGPAQRLFRALDQQPGFLVDVADEEGVVGVAVHAADERRDVDVENVAVLDHRAVRDAVADHLVERRAE